ncbi:histidine phosphatase family protein [Demequina lutea]|uniref:Broad specificity phosphatase PhoE n=1 Tax=Demequina lutea TaxID=431489 RepID=A0A7Z0CIW0_9MICO|nr:histidine phosphatase family protein [Demequina lutea]NYI42389.1 broad specificity phosphatase PhoE [Demequina lutea]
MPTVHLVRHGQVHNPDRVLYGRLPQFRLSEAGEMMAQSVADYLVAEKVPVKRVIASPLERARQTAAPIAAAFGLPVDTEPRIIEAGNVYEGERLQSGVKDFIHPRNWWRLRNPWKPSWGEPFTEQADRMWAAIREAAAATPDGDTVMVSHQLPIWVARLSFEGRSFLHDPRKRECALASVTSFVFEDGEPVSMTYASPAAHVARS